MDDKIQDSPTAISMEAHEFSEDVMLEEKKGTTHDAQDMKRMGKVQLFKVKSRYSRAQ